MSSKSLRIGPALAALALVSAAPGLAPAQPAPAPSYAPSDWKQVDPANLMVIDTSKGRIIVEMREEFSKEHVDQVKALIKQGYYDGLQFFRVVDEFMAQTGDKTNTGSGDAAGVPILKGAFSFRRGPETPFAQIKDANGQASGFVGPNPTYTQPDDLMGLTADGKVKALGLFCDGVAGMARTSQPDTASSQFFLMRHPAKALDGKYTPWGRVLVGLDVVRAIAVGEPPPHPDVMTKVQLASDMPAADRPNVWRIDTAGAAFRAQEAAVAAAKGAAFSPCDITVPAEVRK